MSDVLWVRPAIHGAVGGMVALSIVGFSWGGRETERSSSKRAAKETKAAMIAAIVPVGLDMSTRDPSREARLALLGQAGSSSRRV